jgi:hypothetical protein
MSEAVIYTTTNTNIPVNKTEEGLTVITVPKGSIVFVVDELNKQPIQQILSSNMFRKLGEEKNALKELTVQNTLDDNNVTNNKKAVPQALLDALNLPVRDVNFISQAYLTGHQVDTSHTKDSSLTAQRLSEPKKLREMVLSACKWLTAKEVSEEAGLVNANTSSAPNKWKKANKIFAISHAGSDLFPQFALGDDGKPLPIIKVILDTFDGKKSPWAIAAWFVSSNSWLGGDTPMNILTSIPDAVVEAARMEVNSSQHGK